MLEGRDSIQRFSRLYYAHLNSSVGESKGNTGLVGNSDTLVGKEREHSTVLTSSAKGPVESEGDIDSTFGRPLILSRLGQFIMDVKVVT